MVASGMLWPGIGTIRPSFSVLCRARPEQHDADKRAPAADRVHQGRPGEIVETHCVEPTAAPLPRADDRIDEGDEQVANTMNESSLIRSATAPDTIVAQVAANIALEQEVGPVRVADRRRSRGVDRLRPGTGRMPRKPKYCR